MAHIWVPLQATFLPGGQPVSKIQPTDYRRPSYLVSFGTIWRAVAISEFPVGWAMVSGTTILQFNSGLWLVMPLLLPHWDCTRRSSQKASCMQIYQYISWRRQHITVSYLGLFSFIALSPLVTASTSDSSVSTTDASQIFPFAMAALLVCPIIFPRACRTSSTGCLFFCFQLIYLRQNPLPLP